MAPCQPYKLTSAPGWVPRDRRECGWLQLHLEDVYNPLRKILAREYIANTNVASSDAFAVPIWKHFEKLGFSATTHPNEQYEGQTA